jgi:TRAP-type C4-dicarboxylate transport system permease small subunit
MLFKKILDATLEALTAFFLAAMVFLTLLQVVGRYGLEAAFDWTEELARLTLIYLTFFGSIVALRKSQLLRLDFVVNAFPLAIRRWLEATVDVISIIVLGVVVWQGVPLLWRFWAVRSAALSWPTTYFYLPVVIGCLGMLLFTCVKAWRAFEGNIENQDSGESTK